MDAAEEREVVGAQRFRLPRGLQGSPVGCHRGAAAEQQAGKVKVGDADRHHPAVGV